MRELTRRNTLLNEIYYPWLKKGHNERLLRKNQQTGIQSIALLLCKVSPRNDLQNGGGKYYLKNKSSKKKIQVGDDGQKKEKKTDGKIQQQGITLPAPSH